MSGLRFAMVTTFYPPYNFGGDGMGIQRFSRALVRRGHDVTVVQDIDAYRVLSDGPAPTVNDADGVKVVRLQSGMPLLSVLLTQQTGRPVLHGRQIRRVLDEGGFDVIVYHNVSLVGGPGVLAAGNALKLYMAHEHWLVCPSHVLWRHNREACPGRQCLRCVLAHRRPPQLWRYTGYLKRQLHHVDAFIAMSEFSRDKHHEFGFPRPMEVVNYFLPDDDTASPEQPEGESPHPRPYFLFVGRLERLKGLDDVIPVFRDFSGADLVIAGDGEHGEVLRGLGRGIDSVKFLGRLAPEALTAYYRHAIALIVPSVGFETFGIILIESMRQGTPVIARRIGPFPEIVDRSGGGLLFDGPDDLKQALERLQGDEELRQRLARSGREAFREHWSEQAVIPKFLRVVRQAALARGDERIAAELGPEVGE
jgi:glycosyltransferase involved in cell wall biosynthesis